LDEIWLYIAHDNPDAADKYIRAIVSRFPTLASMPHNRRLTTLQESCERFSFSRGRRPGCGERSTTPAPRISRDSALEATIQQPLKQHVWCKCVA